MNTALLQKIILYSTFLILSSISFLHTQAMEIETNAQTVSFDLPLLSGRVRTGEYAVRVSVWDTQTLQTNELLSGTTKPNFDSAHFLGYSEQFKVQPNAKGTVNMVLGNKVPLINIKGASYLQIEFRPSNTDPQNFITLDADENSAGVQRFTNKIEYKANPLLQEDPILFSGVLLGKSGKPEISPHRIRFSLWRSADIDSFFDQYSDGTLNVDSSNFLYYVLEKEVTPDANGRFSADISFMINAAKSFSPRDVFMQVELRAKDENATYQLIDPDADRFTRIDRYKINDGILSADNSGPQLSPLGNTGKWLVSQIPAGTTRNNFELGLGNSDPSAMIEIRANQGKEKKGVLRFNGTTNKWEVSSDGEVFDEIATSYASLKGTNENTFTIGLDDAALNRTWKLQFGGSLNPASISYDSQRNTFLFNRNVDFEQNQLLNAVLENRSSPPMTPKEGQQYFNTNEKKAYYFNGSSWIAMGGSSFTTIVYNGGSGNKNSTPAPSSSTPNLNINGTTANTFVLNRDQITNSDVTIEAKQSTGNSGKLRYNAATKQWELSNDGGLFSAIADVSTPQTLTNKTIDGDENTITDIDFSSLKPRSKTQTFTAAYEGATLHPDGTNNKGVVETLFDSIAQYSYYAWTTSQATLQDYDIILTWKVPKDFISFDTTPLSFYHRTSSVDPLKSDVSIELLNGVGVSQSLILNASPDPIVNGWEKEEATFTAAPTFSPGEMVIIKVKLSTVAEERAEIGSIDLNYKGK